MRVEFYLIDAMEVNHFAPVLVALRVLGVDAVFVSCRGAANSAGQSWYDGETAEALLKTLNLPFVSCSDPHAEVAVTTQIEGILRDYRNIRVRMTYGVNLCGLLYGSPEAHVGFDLYLVHGPLNKRLSNRFVAANRIRIIGYPRFDAWFNGAFDQELIRKSNGVTGSKPTLLYLPTWEHRSSIDAFADSIGDLAAKFEILVRPHHCTFRMEQERMRKLKSCPMRILSPGMASEVAFAMADVVIADISSGALADALLMNKKVVGVGRQVDMESLLVPKLKEILPFCLEPGRLSQNIDEAWSLDMRSSAIQDIRKDLFDTTNGADALRAANAIVTFVQEERRHPSRALRRKLKAQLRPLSRQGTIWTNRLRHPVRTIRNGLGRVTKKSTWWLWRRFILTKMRLTGNVNFFRLNYNGEKNRALVELCKRNDIDGIQRHLDQQDSLPRDKDRDEYFENRPGMQAIYDIIARLNRVCSILDLGCGPCLLLRRLKDLGHDVAGTDLSPIRVAKNRQDIPKLVCSPCESIPFDSRMFDIAISQECLEHVVDLDASLREIYRVLRPEGILYCQVPKRHFADCVNHVRLFDEGILRTACEIVGFEVQSVSLIPYLHGETAANIFLTARKPGDVGLADAGSWPA